MAGEPEPEPEVEPLGLSRKERKALEKQLKSERKAEAKEAKQREKERKKRVKNGEPDLEPELADPDLAGPAPEDYNGGSGGSSGGSSSGSSDEEAPGASDDDSVTESESDTQSDSEGSGSDDQGEGDAEDEGGDDSDEGGDDGADEEENPEAKKIYANGLRVRELVKERGNSVALESLMRKLGDVSMQADVANFQADAGAELPLHIAARAKHSQLCASLLTFGADIDRLCRYTPLQLACLPPYEPPWDVAPTCFSVDLPVEFCARTLLEVGAEVNAVDQMGLTAIQLVIKGLVDYNQKRQERWVERLRQEHEALAQQAVEGARRAKEREKQRAKELQRRKRVAAEAAAKKKVRRSEATIKEEAAIKIQTKFRAISARRKFQIARKEIAATKLQQVVRGRSARKLLWQSCPDHMNTLKTIGQEHKERRTRVMKQEFGQCVIDIVRCLLNYKVRIDVEDDDYNTLLHLAAQTGDTYGPTLINMLLKRNAPSKTKNRKGLTPLELAIAMDHGACALALKPEEPKLSELEKIERSKGYYEEAPTEFQLTELSPFVRALGDILYSSPWPSAYRDMLEREQPQRANERLPQQAPVEFLAAVDTTRRGWEAPFEIKDRAALSALLTITSPRLRKPPPGSDIPLAARQQMAPTKDIDSERWMDNMMELLFEHKTVEVFKGGNGSVTVHGYGLATQGGHVATLNVNVDEVWVYRYRAQNGQSPPGLEDVETQMDLDEGIETMEMPEPKRKDSPRSAGDVAVTSDAARKDRHVVGKEAHADAERQDAQDLDTEDYEDEEDTDSRPSSAVPLDILDAQRVQGMRSMKGTSAAQVTAVGAIGVAGLITGHKDGSVRLWVKGKQRSDEEGIRLGRHDGEITSVVVVGRHAFSGSIDGSVRHWNTFKEVCVGMLPGHVEGVTAMCVADDRAASPEPTILAVAARDGGIRLWVVDREDYACLCVINCPEPETRITSVCFDPDTPCLYAAGSATAKGGKKGPESHSFLMCFSVAKFLQMHMLMPTLPEKPTLRRIAPLAKAPEPEIEGLDDSDDDTDMEAARKRAKKDQKAADAKKEKYEEDLQADEGSGRRKQAEMVQGHLEYEALEYLLETCTYAGILPREDMVGILDGIENIQDNAEFKEQIEVQRQFYQNELDQFEAENPELSRQQHEEEAQQANDLAVLDATADRAKGMIHLDAVDVEAPHASNNEKAIAEIMALGSSDNQKKDSTPSSLFSRKLPTKDKYARYKELSRELGIDPRRGGQTHKQDEEQTVRPMKDKTIDIIRTEINPLRGQRLPFIAAGYRMLIPGCLYSYTIEVKNGGAQDAWLSIDDPLEPFTEFLMCEPPGEYVRVATIVKNDGRKKFSIVWKVRVPSSQSKKLTIMVRALTRPIYTERLEGKSCYTLFKGKGEITSMLWIETGPVLGFNDGSIISFGAYIPPKDKLSRMRWDEIAPKAVSLGKQMARIPVGRSRVMRCKKCLVCLACCWNPLMWKCWRRKNALEKILPQSMHSDVDIAELHHGGKGAYKNSNRRLLTGFKRSTRLRDGQWLADDQMTEHIEGKPVECMWYNKTDRELFFGISDVVSSIDVTARMNPWASPSQILPPEDYMTQLAVVRSDIKGLLNVHGDDDLLVISEDGSVRRLFLVKKDAGALAKLWTKHVVEKLTGLQSWLDEKLGHITPGGEKDRDVALDLHCINGKMYSVRQDGQVARWAPDFQLMQWQKSTADRLPNHITTKIKHTAAGAVKVVEVIEADFAPKIHEIRLTNPIGVLNLFLVVCESPSKRKSEIDKEKAKKHSDGGSDSDYYSDYYSDDEDSGVMQALGNPTGLNPDGEDQSEGYDPVHTPADTIMLWNATTGREINLNHKAEEGEGSLLGAHPQGSISCAIITAEHIIIGRDCGNLIAYNLEISGDGTEELIPAQNFDGHQGKKIDFVRAVGHLKGERPEESTCSRVLLYSISQTLVLVHEIKSGCKVFKFDLGKDDGKVRDFDVIRLSDEAETEATGNVLDHFVAAVGRDVHVWTLEGNIDELVEYEVLLRSSHGGDLDDDELPTKADDVDEDQEEDQEPDLVFEMSADKPVEEKHIVETNGPPTPKKEERRVKVYNGHTKPITCMQVVGNKDKDLPGGYAFTGCVQGSIRVWGCAKPFSNLLVLNATEGPVSRLLVPDLGTVWASYGGFIRSWDLGAVHADLARRKQIATRPKTAEVLKPTTSTDLALLNLAEEEHADMPEAEIHSATTGASTTVLPVGHSSIPTVRSLAAVPELVSEGKGLRQTYKVYASCVDGSVYSLTPVRKEPIYTTQTHVAKERLHGSVLAVIICFVEFLHLIGIPFTVRDALWPPVLSPMAALFGSLFGTTSSYTDEGWAGSFWAALIFGGIYLGAMVAQISTNLLTREEFAWKFGGSTGGMVVLTHFGCIGLRIVDFFVGVVLFITISRPLLATFVCGGNGASAEQEAQCWTMSHLTNCAIAAPAAYIYAMMSWRIQRAYGDCGLFASRSVVDLFQFDRDNVHASRVHHLINFPNYCNASMYATQRKQ
eukprot:COSAG02_NODE_1033_length_15063_cov_14.987503_4_plen_2516_part_00